MKDVFLIRTCRCDGGTVGLGASYAHRGGCDAGKRGSLPLVRRIAVAAFVAGLLFLGGTVGVSQSQGEVLGRILQRAPQPAPNTSTAYAPVQGQPPYFGKALGATYYAWGYFGARENCQRSLRVGYYNEYPQWGHRKGY